MLYLVKYVVHVTHHDGEQLLLCQANLVKNVPSSTAESPPPITNRRLFLKNAPSHTAQLHRVHQVLVHGTPIFLYSAPVAIMTALAVNSLLPKLITLYSPLSSTDLISPY